MPPKKVEGLPYESSARVPGSNRPRSSWAGNRCGFGPPGCWPGWNQRFDRLEIRLLPEEKKKIERAAKAANLKVSAWMREKLVKAAEKELG